MIYKQEMQLQYDRYTKKYLPKSFWGLQPSGVCLLQAKSFFFLSKLTLTFSSGSPPLETTLEHNCYDGML